MPIYLCGAISFVRIDLFIGLAWPIYTHSDIILWEQRVSVFLFYFQKKKWTKLQPNEKSTREKKIKIEISNNVHRSNRKKSQKKELLQMLWTILSDIVQKFHDFPIWKF